MLGHLTRAHSVMLHERGYLYWASALAMIEHSPEPQYLCAPQLLLQYDVGNLFALTDPHDASDTPRQR